MASVLDIGLINQFAGVFTILFIFLVIYAILTVTKLLGDNQGVSGLIALLIALLSATQPQALAVVSGMSPVFVILLMFLMFMFLAAKFAGFDTNDIIGMLGGRPGAAAWILIFSLIALFFVMANVFGQGFLESFSEFQGGEAVNATGEGSTSTSSTSFNTNLGNTIFHPKILGFILIMLIGAFAIALLTGGAPMVH